MFLIIKRSKKTTEVLIILICSQKINVYCLRKLIACVQIAERSASAGISYSQLQIQILLQKMSSMMRIFPIISWSKVKKTTEVFIILIYIQKQKSFFPVKSTYLLKNAERSASAGISFSQLQIQIMLQIMSSIMRIIPIISWSKVKKTTEVFVIFICRQKKVSSQ